MAMSEELIVQIRNALFAVAVFALLAFACAAVGCAPVPYNAAQPQGMEFTESDCEELQTVLHIAYQAAAFGVAKEDVRAGLRFGPAANAVEIEYVKIAVDRVYDEYPATTTGKQVIQECFANAAKKAGEPT